MGRGKMRVGLVPKKIRDKNGKATTVWVRAGEKQKPKDMTQTPEFKKWFGKSKMVNNDGSPMVVYHGTNREFSEFSMDKGHSHDLGFYGRGIYFTFGGSWSKGEASYYGNRVVEAYLKIEKPFVFSSLSEYKGVDISILGTESMVFLWNIAKKFPEIAKGFKLEKRGKFNRELGDYGEREPTTYVPATILPALVEKYAKKLKTFEIKNNQGEDVVSGYVKSETITSKRDDGSTYSWESTEDLGRWNLVKKDGKQTEKNKKETEIGMIFEAIEKYEGLSTSYMPEGLTTRHPELTEAIKKRGYDGILQTLEGDEVVVFSPSQIRIKNK